VLSPDAPYSPIVLGVTFGLLMAGLLVNAIVKDRKEFRRFSRLRATEKRQRIMRKWLLQSFAVFGGTGVVTTVLAFQYMKPMLDALDDIRWIRDTKAALTSGIGLGIVIVVAIVILVGGTLAIWAARTETEIPSVGDVQALLPRNRAELKYGAGLSINAGIVEELLFRLGMPAVIFGFSSNAVLAVVVSVLVFGLLHAYQGIPGIVGTMIIGAVLMALYLASGNILVPMIAHALFDLRSLVLIPVVVMKVHRVLPQKAPASSA